jgi:hypothetical protein
LHKNFVLNLNKFGEKNPNIISMINFGRAIGQFNRVSPKISRCIGQVAHIARNVGQAIGNVRNIGSTVNTMSDGRIGAMVLPHLVRECKK